MCQRWKSGSVQLLSIGEGSMASNRDEENRMFLGIADL